MRGETKVSAPLGVYEKPVTEGAFQDRVVSWATHCFNADPKSDVHERNHRFIEESLELVQACGTSRSEAHQLVDYVFDRDVGEKSQEVGGVMTTLAILCYVQDLDMVDCGETELARIWTKVEKIRAKQAAKPKHSPLPEKVVNYAQVQHWTECRDMFCVGSVSWKLLNEKIECYVAEGEEFPNSELTGDGQCVVSPVSSACCSRGVKGCYILHSKQLD